MKIKYSEKCIGLDISEKVLRVVQLQKVSKKIKLVSYNEVFLEAGIIKDCSVGKECLIENKLNFNQAINQLIKTAVGKRIYTPFIITCLPEQKTLIKLIDITALAKDVKNPLAEIVEEAKKHIPFPLETTYFDWQYCNQEKNQVLVGICPKEIVDNYQQALNQSGLITTVMEIEAVALSRALFPLNKPVSDPVLVIDFGASRTGVFIYEKDYVPFSLSLSLSGISLTNFIKDKLKISLDEAERAKCSLGLNTSLANGGLLKIIKEPLAELAKQIKEAKYFYYEHFPKAAEIKEMQIIGGGANLPGLIDFLKEEIKLEVKLGNPMVNLDNENCLLPESKRLNFATAIGLALREYL